MSLQQSTLFAYSGESKWGQGAMPPKLMPNLYRIVLGTCTCMSCLSLIIVYTAVQPLWNCCTKLSEIGLRATRWLLWHSDFTKFNFGRGAYNASLDPVVGWGGGYPFPFSTPSTPLVYRCRRFRRRGWVPSAPRNEQWRWPLK